jgi:RNA polymerase sigma factor (sigma-70 family)
MGTPPDLRQDDLSRLTDEELVLRARGPDPDRAWHELERRDQGRLARLVVWLARRYRLSWADLEDARQEADLAWLKAIHQYELDQAAGAGRCPFRHFLRRVVLRCLLNFLRSYRRAERALDRSAPATAALETVQAPVGADWDFGRTDSQPVREVQQQERQLRVGETVRRLGAQERRLAERLMDRTTLVQIAQELGVSYGVIRGEERRLKEKLKICLADL